MPRSLAAILFSFFLIFPFAADAASDQMLRSLLDSFAAGGEEGVRALAGTTPALLRESFIEESGKEAVSGRNDDLLSALLVLARLSGDDRLLADQFRNRGHLRQSGGMLPKALADYDSAILLYRKLEMPDFEADVLKRQGDVRLLQGEKGAALALYDAAEAIYSRSDDPVGQGNACRSRGAALEAAGDAAAARLQYEKALELYTRGESKIGMANAVSSLANLSLAEKDPSTALERLFRAASLFADAGSTRGEAACYLAMGGANRSAGRTKEAAGDYLRALQGFLRSDDPAAAAGAATALGETLCEAGDREGCLQRYHEAARLYEGSGDHLGAGKVYRNIAAVAVQREDAEGKEWLEKALSAYRAAGSAAGEGNVLLDLAEFHRRRGESSPALEMYAGAADAFRRGGEKTGESNALRSRADLLAAEGNEDAALQSYDAAIFLSEAIPDAVGSAEAREGKGGIFLRRGEFLLAEEAFRHALQRYTEAGSDTGCGNALKKLGEIAFLAGDSTRALELYQKALERFVAAGSSAGQGVVYRAWGDVFAVAGEIPRAMELYEKGRAIYEGAGDRTGLAAVLRSQGDLHFYTGNTGKALEMYDKSLEIFASAGDRLGQANVLRSLGDLYASAGETAKALEVFQKAVPHYRALRSPLGLGNVYRSMGDIYSLRREDDRALQMYDLAAGEFSVVNVPLGQAALNRSRGDILLRKGDFASASEMYAAALALYEKTGAPMGLGNLYDSYGDASLRAGDAPRATRMYRRALEQYRKVGDEESAGHAHFRLAAALRRQGLAPDAAQEYEEGIVRLEKVRRQAVLEEMKGSFMRKVHEKYGEAAAFLLENDFAARAFAVAERMKARLFLDRLAEAAVDLEGGVDPEQRRKRDSLRVRLAVLLRQMTHELREQNPDRRKVSSLADEYAGIDAQLEKLEKEIRLQNPLYGSVKYPEPVTVQELQGVLKPDEVVLEYFLTPRGVYCFAVTPTKFGMHKLSAERSEVERLTQLYLEKVTGLEKVAGEAKALYDLLVKPLEGEIVGKKTIVIPDGFLARLPFETLVKGSPDGDRYLLEETPVRYVQSASVLKTLRTLPPRGARGEGFLGFGDPVYSYADYAAGREEKAVREKGEEFPRLEGSGYEVEDIGDIFRGQSRPAEVRVRLDARKENFHDGLEKYGFLHFAAHGLLDGKTQAIVLSMIPSAQDDGYLTIGDLMNSRLNARLVVLSACRSGLGKEERGEGIIGLTRAVMYAGSPSAVVTLWSVSDMSTRALMVEFYERMVAAGMTPEDALRDAKLALLRGKYANPFYWGAVVMYGE